MSQDEWSLRADWCKKNNVSPYTLQFWNASIIGICENISYKEVINKYTSAEIVLKVEAFNIKEKK